MVLVTGGTGLLGSHLIYKLVSSGVKVRATKRPDSNINHVKDIFSYYTNNSEQLFSAINWIETDLLDSFSLSEAMEGVDDVYHCAAIVSFLKRDKERLLKINVEGTSNIVNVALEKGIRKLCYVSSIATLGRNENDGLINENTHWKSSNKNSVYAQSKFYAENEVWRGINEGLNAVILNPAIIFGPGFWHKGSNELIKTLYDGLKFYPEGVNGFVDVRDVVRIMVDLMQSDISAQRFILASASLSYKELCDLFAAYLGVKTPSIKAVRTFAEAYWRFEYLRALLLNSKPLITKETVNTSYEKYYYSNEKVRKALNFEFIPIEETARFLSELFLKHIKLND